MGISDTTWIAGLLAVALVISVVGTLSIANKFSTSGLATGTLGGTVASTVEISIPVGDVDFGSVTLGETKDTLTGPAPFTIQNDGSANVDVDIMSASLWSSGSVATSDMQFKCGDGQATCPLGSIIVWADMPIDGDDPATLIVSDLSAIDNNDQVKAEIKIHVPTDEAAGAKGPATVTFTASEHV